MSRESSQKNGTRGSGRAPRLKQPPSLVLLINLRIDWHEAKIVSSKALREKYPNKHALPTAVRPKKVKRKKQRTPRAYRSEHCRPRKQTTPNCTVGPRKGRGKLWFHSRRAPVSKKESAHHPYHYGKVV